MGIHRIPIDRDTAAVGRIMVDVVSVAKRPADRGGRGQGESDPTRGDAVPPRAVEVIGPVGPFTRGPRRPGEAVGPAARRRLPAACAKASAPDRGVHPCRPPPFAGEDLDHPGQRIGAVKHASRPADHFDPFDVVQRERIEIECPARLVHRHTVDEHLHMIAFGPSEEERRLSPERAAAHDRGAGDLAEGVGHRADPPRPQFIALEHRDTPAHHPDGQRHPLGRHHDRRDLVDGVVGGHLGREEPRDEEDEER